MFREPPQASMNVVEAYIDFHGSRGKLTQTEVSITSVEASTASMATSIILIEAHTSFH